MEHVKQFAIGGKNYNVKRTSAAQQSEVLSMMAAPITLRWAAKSEAVDNFTNDIVVPMLLSMDYQTKTYIADILLSKVMHDGKDVSINDFDGRMIEYHILLAQVLHWNLDDFFTYIANAHAADLKAVETNESPVQ